MTAERVLGEASIETQISVHRSSSSWDMTERSISIYTYAPFEDKLRLDSVQIQKWRPDTSNIQISLRTCPPIGRYPRPMTSHPPAVTHKPLRTNRYHPEREGHKQHTDRIPDITKVSCRDSFGLFSIPATFAHLCHDVFTARYYTY